MKSTCCDKEMVSFTARSYPFESGYKCPCCGQEWSDLQMARDEHLGKHEPWAICKCGKYKRR